mgnify:FL=1
MSDIIINGKTYNGIKAINVNTTGNSIARYLENAEVWNVSGRRKLTNGAVCFIDDDCRSEVMTKLLPTIRSLDIPYGFACPPNSIGKSGYITLDNLKELAKNYNILCHHWNQEGMNTFSTKSAYAENLEKCTAFFEENGIEVDGICYPNGLIRSSYMDEVRKRYKYGFTVDRDSNSTPLQTYYIKRVECFPTNGMYGIEYLKKYVDQALKYKRLVVFMTHCWYETFNTTVLTELVNYINEKELDILSPAEAFEKFGNIIEVGDVLFPFDVHNSNFFVVGKTGSIYYNQAVSYIKSEYALNRVNFGWTSGYSVNANGKLTSVSSPLRIASEKIAVTGGHTYTLLNVSNIYANLLYAVYNESGTLLKSVASTNDAKGTFQSRVDVTMPDDASYMFMCCNMDNYLPFFELFEHVTSFSQ